MPEYSANVSDMVRRAVLAKVTLSKLPGKEERNQRLWLFLQAWEVWIPIMQLEFPAQLGSHEFWVSQDHLECKYPIPILLFPRHYFSSLGPSVSAERNK